MIAIFHSTTTIFRVALCVEISAGYSGRRRNLEIINSSGIYEKRLKPTHIVMDNGDERGENGWKEWGRKREKEREEEEEEKERRRKILLSREAKLTIVIARTFLNSVSVVLIQRVSFHQLHPSLSHMKRFIKLAPA